MKLQEAIARFHALTEACEGDYVTTADGQGGYVQAKKGGKLALKVANQSAKKADLVWVDASDATVNPGGEP